MKEFLIRRIPWTFLLGIITVTALVEVQRPRYTALRSAGLGHPVPSDGMPLIAPLLQALHYHRNPDVWLAAGFGFGLLLFLRGFRTYRRKLLVADTPITPARSVAIGLVQIQGAAKGDGAFPSPVSGTPCYAFKVQIERWKQSSNGGRWAHERTDQNGAPFYLEDASGHVRVDPRGAELDLPRHCCRQVPEPGLGSVFDIGSTFDKGPEPLPLDDAGLYPAQEPKTDEDLLLYAGKTGFFGETRFRFTEYCILPNQQYDVLGTCVENPRRQDENDRRLITKGQNERTYLISSKSEQALERRLSWQSVLMVFGGAALSVICATILLMKHGQF